VCVAHGSKNRRSEKTNRPHRSRADRRRSVRVSCASALLRISVSAEGIPFPGFIAAATIPAESRPIQVQRRPADRVTNRYCHRKKRRYESGPVCPLPRLSAENTHTRSRAPFSRTHTTGSDRIIRIQLLAECVCVLRARAASDIECV